MKKVINNPENVVKEMMEGIMFAYKDFFKKLEKVNGIIKKDLKDKVAIVTGGGSGHEPLFFGVVVDGLADGVSIGNVFAVLTPNIFQELSIAVVSDNGV